MPNKLHFILDLTSLEEGVRAELRDSEEPFGMPIASADAANADAAVLALLNDVTFDIGDELEDALWVRGKKDVDTLERVPDINYTMIGKTVHVVSIEHKYGTNTFVHSTAKGAELGLYEWVVGEWTLDEGIPTDHIKAITEYFDVFAGESYSIEAVTIRV